jgi:hypothetical protein
MSKFTFWGDLYKFAKDVLDEDFHYDKNYQLKAKTKSQDGAAEYNAKIIQTKPDASGESTNTFEIKQTYEHTHQKWETKIKNGGKVDAEVTVDLGKFNETMQGWNYILNAGLVSGQTLDKSSFSSSVKYTQSDLIAKVKSDHGAKGLIDTEFAYKPKEDSHIIIGGEATFDYKKTNLDKYSIGFLGRLNESLSWGIRNWSADGKKFGNFELYSLQSVNATTDVATHVGYSYDTKELAAKAGFVHSADEDTTWKGKITSDGLFALAWKHKVGANATLTLSSGFDLGNKSILHNNPHPFGVGLEGKF